MRAAAVFAAIGLWGCLADRYRCDDSAACVHDGAAGTCEATGFCSFPDATCDSGRRYGEHADSALRDECVAATSCVRSATAGGRHTCAVRDDGTAWCWGANEAGQLGNGSLSTTMTPTQVVDATGRALDDVVELAAGADFTCARRGDATLWCWGLGARVGDGSDGAQTAPHQVRSSAGALTGVAQVAAGAAHACARVGGDVWCWGANEVGQLGDGMIIDRALAAPVRTADGNALADATTIALGARFSCAAVGERAWCWGENRFGELGTPGGAEVSTSPVIALPFAASALAAGGAHACAIASGGAMWCWGRGDDGQIGTPDLPGSNVAATRVQAFKGSAAAIAAGEAYSCARVGDGVQCWGAGEAGELGDGQMATRADAAVAVRDAAGPITGVLGVTAARGDYHNVGGRHSCAWSADALWCWGAGEDGQLGTGASSAIAVRIDGVCR